MVTSAFGRLPERRWDTDDREGREYRKPFVETPKSLWRFVGGPLEDEATAWWNVMHSSVGALYPVLAGRAEQLILTATANDAIALMNHVGRFDGRSAAHAARALFEHLVNALDVDTSSVNTADRYVRHRHVTEDQVSRRRWYLPLLPKGARKSEQARLNRLGGRAAAPLAQALAEFGPTFRRGWASGSLKDRAEAHGLGDDYEGYRILSGVIHGSSGALAGVVREVGGRDVHRIGLDLDLAATAYAEGLGSFYRYAEHLVHVTSRTEAERILGLTGNLLLRLPEVRQALRRVDATMWPKEPPPQHASVLAVWPSGAVRWYLYNPQDESIVLADLSEPPSTAQAAALEDLKSRMKDDYDPTYWGGRPMTIEMEGVQVNPRPGARPVPAASILVPPEHPAHPASPYAEKQEG